MGKAKDILLKPITARVAGNFIKRVHYSGRVVQNSQLHIGVFYKGMLQGVMQFGPSLDKRKIMGLVDGTGWNEFIELNRLAFTDVLPRNSESRAIAVAMRLIKKNAPQIKWVISYADAAQCGDGAIYRASGFVLTGIKKNTQIWEAPDGERAARLVKTNRNPGSGREKYVEKVRHARESRMSLTDGRSKTQQGEALRLCRVTATKGNNIKDTGAASMKTFIEAGFKPIPGFQLRYIFFIDKSTRHLLTVPEIPFIRIQEMGAGMYKGEKIRANG